MNTQMHSLREQPQILKNYRDFAANDDHEGFSFIEIVGIVFLAFCVCFTILALAIPGG